MAILVSSATIIPENKNENVKIIVKDTNAIRNRILDKLSMVGEL